jgi:hypothetical protein
MGCLMARWRPYAECDAFTDRGAREIAQVAMTYGDIDVVADCGADPT